MNARDWEHYRARRVSENGCMAIRLGGRGNVTRSHLIWRHQKSLPDGGFADPLSWRALPGAQRRHRDGFGSGQRERFSSRAGCRDALDGFYASPVAGDGKIYMVSDAGKAVVLEPGPDWKVLQTNDLNEDVYATPAIAGGCLLIRTTSRLYCFGASTGIASIDESSADAPAVHR